MTAHLTEAEVETLARAAHEGQTDKAGRPYAEHLQAVAEGVRLRGGDAEQIAAAWLHDSGLYLQSHAAQAGVGCALGGAAGNLLDILRRGHVVDFIDLGWWPVFNLADVAIVGGLLFAFWGMVSQG